ncbi:MAG: hypothetical protein KJ795_02175 [Gammaproteobacteria bacterium]|nr:hypothetical protein [Gammaproteobacteria bacterium]MBU1776142.1 hypothetical protein [Gammaproteobacteria bacterium]
MLNLNETYSDAHAENATDLYELRQSWLDMADVSVNEFNSVEERLNASLCLIASTRIIEETSEESPQANNKKEPTKEHDCFIILASHINSPHIATRAAGYDLAYQWLAQDAGKSAAAEAALSLYPEADHSRLLKLYDEQEALRPVLFRIFRKQMLALPIAMVNTAATAESSADALKIEALRYAAANAEIGMDIFRTHYQPLLSGKAQFDARIVEAAIWGGMVRNDPDATRVISTAISLNPSPKYRTQLLRLAALSGAAEFLPLLLQAAESEPATGYPLLVLFGQKSVMPEHIKALENARSMEHAAAAFSQLSDQILPRIPRLTVVGEEEDDEEEDAPHIPDVKAARAWWDKHQANWKTEERWLFGKPVTTEHLTALAKKHAGRFGHDIMALLALSKKAPLNIPSEIWRARQQQLLADKLSAQPATKPAAKPMSARHA